MKLWHLFSAMVPLICLGCEPRWPDEGVAEVERLIEKGPEKIRCWDSPWMKTAGRIHYDSQSSEQSCRFTKSNLNIRVLDDRIVGTARCKSLFRETEIQVTIFKHESDKDYFGGAYFCSIASDESLADHATGSLTISPIIK